MLKDFANMIRVLSCEMVNSAGSGHQGGALGFADVMSVLFNKSMNFSPNNPNRDRLVLSAGHMGAMLYSAIYLSGKTDLLIDDLKNFRKLHSRCQGHPKIDRNLGIEMTTGALGQGIGTSVGIAIALKKKKIDSKVFVIVGDGDLMEGVSHEAMTLAKSLNLNNLIVLFDNNNVCIDGKAEDFTTDNISRFKAYGFEVIEADGHDFGEIENALEKAKNSEKPVFVSFKTAIGKYSKCEGSNSCHGKFLDDNDIKEMRKKFGFPIESFSVPFEIQKKETFNNSEISVDKDKLNEAVLEIKKEFLKNPLKKATRQLGGIVFNKLLKNIEILIGGSADLSQSTCLYSENSKSITDHDFDGNFVHYGIREHAMGCALNGLAVEGFVPYGGTFLVFSDYMRPAIRNAALMKIGSIFVFTHDSIGVGEDGETHQPIEQLSSLRLIQNLLVFRPSCDIEVAECIQIAVENRNIPSAVILSRQNVSNIIKKVSENNYCRKGIYEVKNYELNDKEKLTIIASGTEVSLAFELCDHVKNNFNLRILSAPCLELFDEQSVEYKEKILLGDRKLIIEAGVSDIWHKYTSEKDIVVGLKEFGTSGKCDELYDYFGISVKKIATSLHI